MSNCVECSCGSVPVAYCSDRQHSDVWTRAERSFCSLPGTCRCYLGNRDKQREIPSLLIPPAFSTLWKDGWSLTWLWPHTVKKSRSGKVQDRGVCACVCVKMCTGDVTMHTKLQWSGSYFYCIRFQWGDCLLVLLLTILWVGQQEDIGMLRIVSHHGHETHHTHALTGRRLELDRGQKETEFIFFLMMTLLCLMHLLIQVLYASPLDLACEPTCVLHKVLITLWVTHKTAVMSLVSLFNECYHLSVHPLCQTPTSPLHTHAHTHLKSYPVSPLSSWSFS